MPPVNTRVVKTAYSALPNASISVPGFDGPLELLLHHLGNGEMVITDVSLSAVADQYLSLVRLLPASAERLDFLAEFLVIGAQLLVLKSRALLPREVQRAADGEEVLDEVSLERRLQEYRRIRAAASQLDERQSRGARSFQRTSLPPLPAPPPPPRLERAEPDQLAAAFQRLLAARAPAAEPDLPPRVTIAERIAQVQSLVRRLGKVSFLWLAEDCQSRAELIVTFLAVLELYRTHTIDLAQDELFGEIWIGPAGPPTTVNG